MQTRRMITALVASIAIFYLWMVLSQRIWPPAPGPTSQPADTQLSPETSRGGPGPTTQPRSTSPARPREIPPAVVATAPGQPRVSRGTTNEPILLGNADKDSPYPMAVTIMPRGAAVGEIGIRGHYKTVEKQMPYPVVEPMPVSDQRYENGLAYSFTTSIRFDNLDADLSLDDKLWSVREAAEEKVVLSVDIATPDDKPLARVIKTYQLRKQPRKEQTCDLNLSLEIESLTDRPLRVILTQQGPIGFKKEDPRSEDRKVIGAFWQDGEFSAKGHLRKEIFKNHNIKLGSDTQGTPPMPIAWAAEANLYFTCIMAPAGRTGPDDTPRFASLEAIHLTDAAQDSDGDLTFRYITRPIDIAPGQAADVAFDCYVGPKAKSAFENVPAYSQRQYYYVISESFLWCAPAALVGVMMWLLNAFHAIPPHNYGLAIIVLVLVVRGILHPITKKSQVNMMRMQKQTAKLQPKIQAVKEKYANDRAAMNQAIMEVYREEGVNPAGQMLTCLPMMLQIPIWGALWTALASTIELRHAPFDGWWIKDLTTPDALYTLKSAFTLPLMGRIESLNLLPVFLGISQVLQTKFMPRGNPGAPASKNPDQLEQQRKMMMFMSVFFVFILYNAPSGLNLYIMASNFFGILEQWRIRQHLAQIEEKQARERSLTPEPAKDAVSKAGPKPPRHKSWIERKWNELAKRAEDAKRIQSQHKKTKSRR